MEVSELVVMEVGTIPTLTVITLVAMVEEPQRMVLATPADMDIRREQLDEVEAQAHQEQADVELEPLAMVATVEDAEEILRVALTVTPPDLAARDR